MPLARYKDLCIDAVDDDRMQSFWSGALGLAVEHYDNGQEQLVGATPQHGVWICQVPEPRTVKQRVHIDVHATSVEEVERLGAVRLSAEGEFGWTVMADPEGGELCVFVRDQIDDYRLYEVGVDAVDPGPIAHWWAEVIGGQAVDEESGFSYLHEIPGVPFESFDFARVPEPKTVKNRIHWDVEAADVQPLLDHGATLLREPDDEIGWHVLADPEGNEFCCFTETPR